MNCKNCGTPVSAGIKFCPSCGSPIEDGQPQMNNANQNLTPPTGIVNQTTYNQQPSMNTSQPQQPANNMPYNQQPVMSPYTNMNNKKNNNKIFIIVGVVVGIILFAIIVGSMISNSKDSKSGSSNANGSTNTNSSSNTNTNYTEITLNDYKFQVPSNYTGTISNGRLQLTGVDGKSVALIGIINGNYTQIASSQSYIKSYMQNSGYTVNKIGTKTISGREFVVGEVSQSGKNMLMGYTKLDNNRLFMLVVANIYYTIDYNLFNDVVPIIITARAN